VGYIADLPIETVRTLIADSNRESNEGLAKYVLCENRALHADYEFIACQCEDSCWCKRNACSGHYRLKDITFERFIETYVSLWTPPSAREAVKRAVLQGTPVNRRYKNAIPALQDLRKRWHSDLGVARSFRKCGLCDLAEPAIPHIVNLYEAKIWSQLFYDGVIPFDSASKIKIRKAGYADPTKDFSAMNRELFRDLRTLSEKNGLSGADVRWLDQPWTIANKLTPPAHGQPLSRVVDKIFYRPRSKSRAAKPRL
jgi:hypothetical protein